MDFFNPLRKKGYASGIVLPLLKVLKPIVEGNLEETKKRFEMALFSHRIFWGDKEVAYNPAGWYSFPLLAACRIAQKKFGPSFNIKSDYLPDWILDHY